jgi:3-oxoacyl-[acyl-carrier protein] reductase
LEDGNARIKNCSRDGACGILGKAIAAGLLEDGHRVVVVDLDQRKVDELSASFPAGRTLPVACDIGDPAAVESAVKKIKAAWGDVDILVNCAGILSNNKAVQRHPRNGEESWPSTSTELLPFPGLHGRHEEQEMGRIINISSLASKTGGITAGPRIRRRRAR